MADAVSYQLWTWWDSGVGWKRIGGDLTGTSYTHGDLTTGTTYYYAIRAVGANDEAGPWSAFASATPVPAGAPASAPTLTAAPGAGQITLTWTAVEGAASYELWAWDRVYGWLLLGGDLTGTSYAHKNLTAGTTYYYAIRAVNGNGNGPWSAYAKATPV